MTAPHFNPPGQSPEPALENEETISSYPAWYHDIQVRLATEQIDADIRQRASLVEWIAQIDERVSRNTLQVHRHRQALATLGCNQVTWANGTTGHILPCPVHTEAEVTR